MLDAADRIWNRACDSDWNPVRRGDRALHDVLMFHGFIRNGGLDAALESGFGWAARAADGFRVLGSPELADLVARAHEIATRVVDEAGEVDVLDLRREELDEIHALDQRYADLLPSDDTLDRIFRAYLAAHPDDFEPL
jgi:Domain of unknown function (DUF4375)